ncbi:alpha-hydroxy-acid oxidizing protein [Aquisalimonas asiatica]|uniref:FMN-dependent dehydrogenase, includes L-lactate dehydrogenase and type II isopentenyl diphosphate isomerase n=1 Tax=Aquisalimonas asiatica TaxID=406100 RepID=A0A1H8SRP7_9GAMM|nr:alpha-hydroxy-acid oxidizing protein [Aquisalimonas asiatica]SEO81008.1 FMN-dependent dehydrogenase, includes L-lactate dehydrogenase and type II isopentenyl diphosphate isomerase [Aquisalimonas asiatica]
MAHYGDHQLQIYQAGLKGARPRLPMRMEDLEDAAHAVLSRESYWYVAGGAGEITMDANRTAFDKYRIHPRMLTDVSERDLSVTLFDRILPSPLLLAPIGVQSIIRPEAELAVARAAAATNVPMILSTVSAHSMERVAETMGDAPRWFQLYWPRSPELAASFVQRAEQAGYEAVVVTLDTKMMAWRARDLQNAFLPFLNGQGLANYTSDPWFRDGLERPPEEDMWPAVRRWAGEFADPSKTWKDLATLREATKLPILVKGIVHPDDARLALEHGVDGIVVSNHGGRQVDGSIAAIDALPGVATMVNGRVPVLFDSGIRTGSDVLKAKALGADAVLLGRPYIWGLALDGEDGVREVIKRVLADVDLTMALAGKAQFAEVDGSLLVD